jgi:hypothetical protein
VVVRRPVELTVPLNGPRRPPRLTLFRFTLTLSPPGNVMVCFVLRRRGRAVLRPHRVVLLRLRAMGGLYGPLGVLGGDFTATLQPGLSITLRSLRRCGSTYPG